MMNCREATHLVASGDAARAGLFTRIGLRIHLMMCGHCRRYARQVGLLGAVARQMWGPGADDPAELEAMKSKILAAFPETPGTADQKE